MNLPVNIDMNKELYMKPVQIKAREAFLKLAKKHGNGKWAFEELEWLLYVQNIDAYESLNEVEKFDLNTFMIAFRSLYK